MTAYVNRNGVLYDATTRAAAGLCGPDGAEAIGFIAPTEAPSLGS